MTLFLLGGLLMLSSCEAPQGPQALQGTWMILGAKKLVVITEAEIGITSMDMNLDEAQGFSYQATNDSIYITSYEQVDGEYPTYTLSYYMKSNIILIINGFKQLYEDGQSTNVEPVSLLRLTGEIDEEKYQ